MRPTTPPGPEKSPPGAPGRRISALAARHPGALARASPFRRNYLRAQATFGLLVVSAVEHECGVPETTMADPSYILFNKSLEQARRLGARGGKAHACNQRARRARMPAPLPTLPLLPPPRETTAQAIAVLDAQFPWLRGAEKRSSEGQPSSAAHEP